MVAGSTVGVEVSAAELIVRVAARNQHAWDGAQIDTKEAVRLIVDRQFGRRVLLHPALERACRRVRFIAPGQFSIALLGRGAELSA